MGSIMKRILDNWISKMRRKRIKRIVDKNEADKDKNDSG